MTHANSTSSLLTSIWPSFSTFYISRHSHCLFLRCLRGMTWGCFRESSSLHSLSNSNQFLPSLLSILIGISLTPLHKTKNEFAHWLLQGLKSIVLQASKFSYLMVIYLFGVWRPFLHSAWIDHLLIPQSGYPVGTPRNYTVSHWFYFAEDVGMSQSGREFTRYLWTVILQGENKEEEQDRHTPPSRIRSSRKQRQSFSLCMQSVSIWQEWSSIVRCNRKQVILLPLH